MGGHRYSSLLVCYPRRAWAATGIVVCYYPRRAWAATGIVVCWFVCLFDCLSVTHESAHLAATALRLQHG